MAKPLDLTGQRFGKLVAIKRLEERYGRTYLWECQCDCGNICKVSVSSLRSGNTKSCGCNKYSGFVNHNEKQSEEAKISIGTKFGKLTVIEDLGLKPQFDGAEKNRRWYLCQCECGNFKELHGNTLKTSHQISCGDCNMNSRGEWAIQQILEQANINYNHDIVFPQLVEETGRKLRFDFIVYDNDFNPVRFIEFDGRQHFYGPDTTFWGRTTDTLDTIKEKDNIKNDFCLKHNYILVRIPYTVSNVCFEDIFGDKYVVTKGDDFA